MNEMSCPNCGGRLVDYRVERQTAGPRVVELHWTICVHCRHVALDAWFFADRVAEDSFAVAGLPDVDDQPPPVPCSERVS